jgi:alpha-beta hydrolase superfamily lysophospholipase
MDLVKTGWLLIVAGVMFLLARLTRQAAPPVVLVIAMLAVLAVFLSAFIFHLSPGRTFTVSLLALFACVVIFSAYGALPPRNSALSGLKPGFLQARDIRETRTLFVLIHGLEGGPDTWKELKAEIAKHGDVLLLDYPAGGMSSSDPESLAQEMANEIPKHWSGQYEHIVLLGHSVGALLARKVYLIAAGRSDPWTAHETRIVLLAGMNRGWDVSGQRPLDMSLGTRIYFAAGAWFGRLTNTGRLILSAQAGAQFVANLRLEWMRWFRTAHANSPLVVQLLGDIDDVVSDADNQDLRAAALGSQFYWLRVRGTGHHDIVHIADTTGANATFAGVGEYRKEKILLAAIGDPGELAAQSDVQAFETNPRVRHVVFILHGIRDLGEWSTGFETELRTNLRPADRDSLAVVSVRYGYFSMGSFLLRPDRQKYVHWFMDQYTETLARFPNAARIDFLGHSNGTYLLASALDQYSQMKIDRIVFAGSVVRQNYDWNRLLGHQVQQVRNYIAVDDAVVALFPRFFERRPVRWLGNDVGSAGFNGFRNCDPARCSQPQIEGGHSAFLKIAPEIARYFMTESISPADAPSVEVIAVRKSLWARALKFHSDYLFFLVPLLIVAIVLLPGVRVAQAAGTQTWLYVLIYISLVVALLIRL